MTLIELTRLPWTGVSTLPVNPRRGVTLIELVVVLIVLVALAVLVVPLLANRSIVSTDGVERTPQQIATETSMRAVRDAIVGGKHPGYVSDMGHLPAQSPGAYPRLHFLFVDPLGQGFDPVTRRGWRGPYLMGGGLFEADAASGFVAMYGQNGDCAVLDAWGRPLVLQQDSVTGRWLIVSAGPDRNLLTETDNLFCALHG